MKTDSFTNKESNTSSSQDDDVWILSFLTKPHNKYLERIQDSFLEDRFNFYGLKEKMENFEDSFLAIQNAKSSKSMEDEGKLYLYAHQRYIFTKAGLEGVLDRVLDKEYGTCPRVGCNNFPVIPVGISNEYGKSNTKVFCHNCVNIYEPKGSLRKLDGAAWGTGFCHFLVLSYSYQFERKSVTEYVPKLFGFRLSEPEDNDSA